MRVLFVCLGNICRSPMAEAVLRELARRRNKELTIDSAATSAEEIGNPVHRGTVQKLRAEQVPVPARRARQLTRADYAAFDWIIGMDSENIRDMLRMLGGDPEGKVRRLLDFSARPRDIADPWYTGDFDTTYADILEGCEAFLKKMENGHD